MDLVIDKMEKIIAATSGGQQGAKLKRVYFNAAAIHSNQVRANIQNLNVSDTLKETLRLSVVTNEGPEEYPNGISAIRQETMTHQLDQNPYWFEYGTVPRATGKGANRGMVKPTPFFRPAIQQSRTAVLESLTTGLKKLIDI
jgi:hypothetical protein